MVRTKRADRKPPAVCRMSALGHKRTCAVHQLMSALGPLADIAPAELN